MQNGTSKAYRVRHLQALQTEDQLKVRMDVFLDPIITVAIPVALGGIFPFGCIGGLGRWRRFFSRLRVHVCMQNGTSKAYRVRHLQALQTEDQLKVRMDVLYETYITP
jgi:hypothetical protein